MFEGDLYVFYIGNTVGFPESLSKIWYRGMFLEKALTNRKYNHVHPQNKIPSCLLQLLRESVNLLISNLKLTSLEPKVCALWVLFLFLSLLPCFHRSPSSIFCVEAGKRQVIEDLMGRAALSHRCSMATVGIDFHVKLFTLRSGASVKMQLWDSAAQGAYLNAMSAFLRGASVRDLGDGCCNHRGGGHLSPRVLRSTCFILVFCFFLLYRKAIAFVYNASNRDSFDFVVNWVSRLEDRAAWQCALIATYDNNRPVVVSEEEASNFSKRHGIRFSGSESRLSTAEVFKEFADSIYFKHVTESVEKTKVVEPSLDAAGHVKLKTTSDKGCVIV
jgi:GTPase SAR1 family protein